MLYPGMPKAELLSWATVHGVENSLHIPTRVLQSRAAREYSTWLWIYKQSEVPIVDLICRETAVSPNKPDGQKAPLTYQKAAISLLQDAANKVKLALQEEVNLLQQPPPKSVSMQKLWEKLLKARAFLRQTVKPRTKGERYSSRIWVEEDPPTVVYREEVQAWCGDGRWPELTIQLDDDDFRVRCRCTKGLMGKCPLAISTIDATLDVLLDPNRKKGQENLERLLSIPKWSRLITSLDTHLQVTDSPKTGEILGWRIKTSNAIQVEPVWCRRTQKGSWAQRKASLSALHDFPSLIETELDAEVVALLLPDKQQKTNPIIAQALRHQAVKKLQNHPNVFLGGQATSTIVVKQGTIQLGVGIVDQQIQIDPLWQGKPINYAVFHARLAKRLAGNILIIIEEDTCYTIDFSVEKQNIIKFLFVKGNQFPIISKGEILLRLPSLAQRFPLVLSAELQGTKHEANSDPIFKIELQENNTLCIQSHVRPLQKSYVTGQGPHILYEYIEGGFVYCERNLELEQQLLEKNLRLLSLAPNQTLWKKQKPDDIFAIISAMEHHQLHVEWIDGKKRLRSIGHGSLSLTISSHEQHFLIDGHVSIDQERILLRDLLIAVRENRPYVLVKNQIWLQLNVELQRRLLQLADTITPKGKHLHLDRQHIKNINEVLNDTSNIDKKWKNNLKKQNNIYSSPVPSATLCTAKLRPYQEDGYEWLCRLSKWARGCCLADEMGLGKTIQTLAFLSTQQGPFLIVAPTSVATNWKQEINRFGPTLHPILYRGPNREERIKTVKNQDTIITNYHILTRDIELLKEIPFSVVVLDEAQMLKNAKSERTRAACKINSKFFIALTGTPIENHLGDLWSIFHVINPSLLGSWNQFQLRFLQKHATKSRENLTKILSPFVLRRKKEDVAKDLPLKIEIEEYVELSLPERQLYQQTHLATASKINVTDPKSRFQILAALTRLRQLACHPRLIDPHHHLQSAKFERCIQILTQLKESNLKVLIFSQFVRLLQLLQERLNTLQFSFCYIDGSTPAEKRDEQINNFQSGNVDCFLLSLKAGGTGINLTKASEIILLDPWWNPAVESQAIDRSHRIGQQNPVTIYRLIARDTIESQIRLLHKQKRETAEGLLGDLDSERLHFSDLVTLLTNSGGEPVES